MRLSAGIILILIVLNGCYFTINAPMCDQIMSDPNAVMPEECRNYNEKEAEKAYFKTSKVKDVNTTVEDSQIKINEE